MTVIDVTAGKVHDEATSHAHRLHLNIQPWPVECSADQSVDKVPKSVRLMVEEEVTFTADQHKNHSYTPCTHL